MEEIEKILTNCIKEIKSGKTTLTECLTRYSSIRNELEPLLKIALNIQELPPLQMNNSDKQIVRARLLHQINVSKQKTHRSFTHIFSLGLPLKYGWARAAISGFVVVILLSVLTGGTAYAAQGSVPGEILYPVKTSTEEIRIFFANNSALKTELNLKFAQTRLEEMSKLEIINDNNTGLAVNGYRRNLDASIQQLLKISDPSVLSDLLNSSLLIIQQQIEYCDEIIDSDPEFSRPVNEANSLAISEQIELLKILAIQNNLQAMQVNLNSMQERLHRARAKVEQSQYQIMEEVLLQYQLLDQLGEQILQDAQTTNQNILEIEELCQQALEGYLDIIEDIYQQVPQEHRENVESCRQMTLQFKEQSRNGNQNHGSNTGPGESPSGNGNNPTPGQDNQPSPQGQGVSDGMINNPSDTGIPPSQEHEGGPGNGPGAEPDGDSQDGHETGSSKTTYSNVIIGRRILLTTSAMSSIDNYKP